MTFTLKLCLATIERHVKSPILEYDGLRRYQAIETGIQHSYALAIQTLCLEVSFKASSKCVAYLLKSRKIKTLKRRDGDTGNRSSFAIYMQTNMGMTV